MSQRVNAGAPTAAARAAPDAVIEALWLVAVVLVPLTFGPPESFAFTDVPKVALTRLLAVLIAAVWAVDIAMKRIDRGDRRDGGLARAAVRLAPSLPAEVDARRRGVLTGRSGAVRCRVPHPLRWALGVRAREGRAVAVEHGVGARDLLRRGAATAHASAAVAACGRPGGRHAAGVALRRSPSGVGGPVRHRRPVRGRGGQLRLSPSRRRGAVARASR